MAGGMVAQVLGAAARVGWVRGVGKRAAPGGTRPGGGDPLLSEPVSGSLDLFTENKTRSVM